ncbi:flagellar hook-length control protein FliK [Hydrogenimonas sp.]
MASMQLAPLLAMLGDAKHTKAKKGFESDEGALFQKLFEMLKEEAGEGQSATALQSVLEELGESDELPVRLALKEENDAKGPSLKERANTAWLQTLLQRPAGENKEAPAPLQSLLAAVEKKADEHPLAGEPPSKTAAPSQPHAEILPAKTPFEERFAFFETLKEIKEAKDAKTLWRVAERAGLAPRKMLYEKESPQPYSSKPTRNQTAPTSRPKPLELSIPAAVVLAKTEKKSLQPASKVATAPSKKASFDKISAPKPKPASPLESLLTDSVKEEPLATSTPPHRRLQDANPIEELAEMFRRHVPANKIETAAKTEAEAVKAMEDASAPKAPQPTAEAPTPPESMETAPHEAKAAAHETLVQKVADAKQTVRHFAQTLREQVENYKSPFSRMQLSLDPKELGSVEVTLISRGNNLHIQVHSNPTAIGLMATQGQELKNQLVSMGFTDVQMQFSMNQQRQQQGRQNPAQANQYGEVEEIPEFYESLDIIVPQYV